VQVCKGVHSKGVHSSFEGKGFAKTASCADRYGRCGNRGRAAAIGHATYIRCSKRMAAGSVREPGWGLVDPFSTVSEQSWVARVHPFLAAWMVWEIVQYSGPA
jgi:hypothetical protein